MSNERPKFNMSLDPVNGGNGLENKENKIENKTTGPIYMVFRENDNWDKYTPKIVEHIKSLGGEIEVKSFPRGTDNETIKEWYEQNKENFQGKSMLTDDTCSPRLDSSRYYEDESSLDNFLMSAEWRLTSEIFKKAFGEEGADNLRYDSLENIKDSYTKLFKLAIENKAPKKVTFVEEAFGHHDTFLVDIKGLQHQSLENDQEVLKFTKQCLVDAGYPETNTSVVTNVEEPADIETMKDEWFFIDSHNTMANMYRDKGLNVFQPGKYSEVVKPKDEEVMNNIEKDLISSIDSKFKKIESIEEFILSYGTDPYLPGSDEFREIIRRVGDAEKLIEIMNHLLDLNKDNPKWKNSSCNRLGNFFYYEELLPSPFNEESKNQIKQRIAEIVA